MIKGKLKLIVPVLLILLVTIIGVTYAFYEYYRVGNNHQLIVGNIYLKYNENTNAINLTNVFPLTKEKARERTDNFITFTVSGLNTTTNKDIWYEIILNEGDEETGKVRAKTEDLVFDLSEVDSDGNELLLVDAMSYDSIYDKSIFVNVVNRNTTTEDQKTYKLRMWLSEDILISDTVEGADYTTSDFANSYASAKVSVYGDFVEKINQDNSNYMVNLSSVSAITDQKANISEVNFISLPTGVINIRAAASPISADVTDKTKVGSVKAWLETDATDSTKYIMYVASEGTIYFPSDCSNMFASYSSATSIDFQNVDTSNVTSMSQMFAGCFSLKKLDVSGFDTANVTDMYNLFVTCSSLTSLDLNSWNTQNVINMSYMFCACSNLVNLNILDWNVERVNELANMFTSCSGLTELDLSGWKGANNVTNMIAMFAGCTNLTNLNISSFTFDKVATSGGMFASMPDNANVTVGGIAQQTWVLDVPTTSRPAAWTTENVIIG